MEIPKVVAATQALRHDLASLASEGLDDVNGQEVAAAIIMGRGNECSLVRTREHFE